MTLPVVGRVLAAAGALALMGCAAAASRASGTMPSDVDGTRDPGPRFEVESVDDLAAVVGEAVGITLPAAAGGTGTLRYVLMPEVPGTAFDPETRALAGEPQVADQYTMTYRVEDAEGSFDELMFVITVEPEGAVVTPRLNPGRRRRLRI